MMFTLNAPSVKSSGGTGVPQAGHTTYSAVHRLGESSLRARPYRRFGRVQSYLQSFVMSAAIAMAEPESLGRSCVAPDWQICLS